MLFNVKDIRFEQVRGIERNRLVVAIVYENPMYEESPVKCFFKRNGGPLNVEKRVKRSRAFGVFTYASVDWNKKKLVKRS